MAKVSSQYLIKQIEATKKARAENDALTRQVNEQKAAERQFAQGQQPAKSAYDRYKDDQTKKASEQSSRQAKEKADQEARREEEKEKRRLAEEERRRSQLEKTDELIGQISAPKPTPAPVPIPDGLDAALKGMRNMNAAEISALLADVRRQTANASTYLKPAQEEKKPVYEGLTAEDMAMEKLLGRKLTANTAQPQKAADGTATAGQTPMFSSESVFNPMNKPTVKTTEQPVAVAGSRPLHTSGSVFSPYNDIVSQGEAELKGLRDSASRARNDADTYFSGDYTADLNNLSWLYADPYERKMAEDALRAKRSEMESAAGNAENAANQKERELQRAKSAQLRMILEYDAVNAPDFRDASARGIELSQKTKTTGSMLFDLGTKDEQNKRETYMSADQKAVYGYYLEKDPAKAKEYLGTLQREINRQAGEDMLKRADAVTDRGFWGGLAASAYTVPAALGEGQAYVINLLDRMQGKEIDPYASHNMTGRVNERIRGNVAENIKNTFGGELGDALSFGYQTGMSIADFLTSAWLTGGGGAVGEALSLASMGTRSAQSATMDALDRGATDQQALTAGFFAGAAEVVFEKVSLESFIKISDPTTRRAVIKNVLKQSFTEASEETFTEIANILSDNAIMGVLSNYNLNRAAYEQNGVSAEEARQAAKQDLCKQVGLAGLGGALAGGPTALVGSLNNYLGNRAIQRMLQGTNGETDGPADNDPLMLAAKEVVAQKDAVPSEDMTAANQTSADPIVNAAMEAALSTQKSENVSREIAPVQGNDASSFDGIDGVENGVVYINRGGKAIEADDVTTGNDAKDALLASETIKRLDGPGAEEYLQQYDPEQSTPEEYALAFGAVYTRAQNGFTPEQAFKGDAAIETFLPMEARLSAWAAGARDFNRRSKAAMTAMNGQNGGKYGLNANYTKSAYGKLTGAQKANVQASTAILDAFGQKFGLKINLVDSIDGGKANGRFDRASGQIDIALDAMDGAYTYIGLHEATHSLKANSTEAFDYLADTVREALEAQGQDVDALVKEQMEKYGYDNDTALEEVVANTVPSILADPETAKRMVSGNRNLAQKIHDAILEVLDFLDRQFEKLKKRGDWKQMQALETDVEGLRKIERALFEGLESVKENAKVEKGTEATSVIETAKHSVNESFEADYDAWAKEKRPYTTIAVGKTSKTLVDLGAKEQSVIMRSDDILHALRHDGMTDEIIKQIPQMMEHPIVVMKSAQLGNKNNHDASRVVMYGNVTDTNGAPVIAVLELRERQEGGQILDMQIIKNAYGKDKALDAQIQKSEILYLDPNKERTNGWLHGIGLQLPPDTTNYGSVGSIFYPDGFVKIQGVKYAELLKSTFNGNIKYSLNEDSTGRSLSNGQADYFAMSKARDEEGRLLKLYHGTESTGFTVFEQRGDKGFFFTDSLKLATVYGGQNQSIFAPGPKTNAFEQEAMEAFASSTNRFEPERGGIYESYLNLEDPLELDAKGAEWDHVRGRGREDKRDRVRTTNEWADIAYEQGYDGVIFRNIKDGSDDVGTVCAAFAPEQIKSVNNANPTSDPDIRYSLREDDKNVQASMDAMQSAFQQTKGHRLNAVEAEKLASGLRQEFNADIDISEIANRIARAYNLAESAGADASAMAQMHDELAAVATDVLEKSKTLNREHEERAKPIRGYLRKTPIRLTEGQWAEAASQTGSMGAYRRALFGRVRLSNDGTALDSLWSELNDMAPDFFPADVSEGDMPRMLLDAVDGLKPQYGNDYGMVAEQMVQYMTMRLNQEYLKLPGVIASAKEQKKLGMSAKEYGQAVRAFQDESKAGFDKALESIRQAKELKGLTENAQRVMALRQTYREWRDNDLAEQKTRETRQKHLNAIQRDTRALLSMLETPTDKKHVPDGMKEAVERFVAALRFGGDTAEMRRLDARINQRAGMESDILSERLNVLASLLDRAERDGISGIGGGLDRDMIDGLRELAETARGKSGISELDENSMAEMRKWVAAIRHAVSTANEMHDHDRRMTVAQAGERTVAELGSKKEKAKRDGMLGLVDDLLNAHMVDAIHFFERLGGAAKERYQALRDGFDKQVKCLQTVSDFMQNATKGVDMGELDGKKAKTQEFDVTGGKLSLTKAQVMELYCLAARKNIQVHLYNGPGLVLKEQSVNPVRVTKADVVKITGTLTAEERVLAAKMQQFMASTCADWGNETSLELYGYKKFTETDYYPASVDKNTVDTKENDKIDGKEQNGFYALKNLGMTKSLQKGARNPLVIGSVFDTFSRHVDQMSRYSSYVVPALDMMRWLNYRNSEAGTSVKRSLERYLGPQGKNYILRLISDINGATIDRDAGEKLFGKLTRNAKVAAVGANLRVAVQQPTAYVRASAVISPKYLLAGMAHKPQVALSKQHCPIALWKSWGFFETDTGRNLRDMIVGSQSAAEKIRSAGTALAGKMDELTWGTLWNACAAEQRDMHPELDAKGEEFYRLVGVRLSEVIDQTQVVDSVFHRTQQMRSGSGIEKMYTAFMSEPMKTYNMLRTAIADYAQDRSRVNGAKLARVLATYVSTALATSAAAALVDAMRSSDEDKEFWEKYLETLGENAMDNLNPVNMMPIAKDVLSMMQGYDPSRMDMQGIQKLLTLGEELSKEISAAFGFGEEKGSSWSDYKKIYKTAEAVGYVTGLPLGAAVRDANAVYQTVAQVFGGRPTPMLNATATASNAGKALYNAMKDGNAVMADKIQEKMRDKLKKNPSEIDSAVGREMAKKDKRVAAAWEAMQQSNAAEVSRIRQEIVADGFSEEIVDKAIVTYGSAHEVETEKEKDMAKELKVKLYGKAELGKAFVKACTDGNTANAMLVFREMVADSETVNAVGGALTTLSEVAKTEYLARFDKNDKAGMNKVSQTLTYMTSQAKGISFSTAQKGVDETVKGWRDMAELKKKSRIMPELETSYQKKLEAASADGELTKDERVSILTKMNCTETQRAYLYATGSGSYYVTSNPFSEVGDINRYLQTAKVDSAKSSLTGTYKPLILAMHDRGDAAGIAKLQRKLEQIELYNKAGNRYYCQWMIDTWIKDYEKKKNNK